MLSLFFWMEKVNETQTRVLVIEASATSCIPEVE